VDAVTMACWGQALQHVDPRRVHAATVNLQNVVTGGIHPRTGNAFVSYLWLEGGQGARTYADGNDYYMMIFIGGASNQPCETLERWYPMYYTEVLAVPDSCGDGKYRGGVGLSRSFEVWGETEITIHGDREQVTPFGLAGGTNGGPNRMMLNQGSVDEEDLGMFCTKKKLFPGDRITFESNGGGGYGLPWERDPARVLEDVIDGYVTIAKARDVYGVEIEEIDPDALLYELDQQETDRLRARLAAKDERPRGLGAHQVHPLGERLIL
jgi:N-methylhydantoinase B